MKSWKDPKSNLWSFKISYKLLFVTSQCLHILTLADDAKL